MSCGAGALSGESVFDFAHDVIREVTYSGTTPARRLHLHRRLAETLMASGEASPAEAAYHFGRAGDPASAIREYQLAGEDAVRLCANSRAMDLLRRALALLGESAASPERDAAELRLLATLGVAAVAVDGYGAQEVTRIYSRAHALAGQSDSRLRAPVLRALSIATSRAEIWTWLIAMERNFLNWLPGLPIASFVPRPTMSSE
jgi:predicted ATPase